MCGGSRGERATPPCKVGDRVGVVGLNAKGSEGLWLSVSAKGDVNDDEIWS